MAPRKAQVMAPLEKMQGQGSFYHKTELPEAAGRDRMTQERSGESSMAKGLGELDRLAPGKAGERLLPFLPQAYAEVFKPSEVWGPLHDQLLPGHCLAQCLCGSHCWCFPSPSPSVTEMVFPGPSTPSSPPILLPEYCVPLLHTGFSPP